MMVENIHRKGAKYAKQEKTTRCVKNPLRPLRLCGAKLFHSLVPSLEIVIRLSTINKIIGIRINVMHPDYRDAAERHWEDASYLSADKRFANADHLYGLSAECALKAVMQGLGMLLRPDGVPMDKQNRIHINLLWDEFSAFAQSRNGARYATGINSMPNPFGDWDVAQRYCHRTEITQTVLENHRQGTRTTIEILKIAVLDGVL